MPIYEYTCESCKKVTEALRKMDEADAPLVCEHCGSKKTHRAHSVPAATGGSSHGSPFAASGGGGHGGGCGCCGGGPRGGCPMQ